MHCRRILYLVEQQGNPVEGKVYRIPHRNPQCWSAPSAWNDCLHAVWGGWGLGSENPAPPDQMAGRGQGLTATKIIEGASTTKPMESGQSHGLGRETRDYCHGVYMRRWAKAKDLLTLILTQTAGHTDYVGEGYLQPQKWAWRLPPSCKQMRSLSKPLAGAWGSLALPKVPWSMVNTLKECRVCLRKYRFPWTSAATGTPFTSELCLSHPTFFLQPQWASEQLHLPPLV